MKFKLLLTTLICTQLFISNSYAMTSNELLSLAPYADSGTIDNAIVQYLEQSSNADLDVIVKLAPYASSAGIDSVIQMYSEATSDIDLNVIRSLAPYASSAGIDNAIQKYSEKSSDINLNLIRLLAPYASSSGIDSAIEKYSETSSDINLKVITTLAPYASSASIDTAIIKTIERGNKNVDAIGKILPYAGDYKRITSTLSKATTKKTVLLEKTITKKEEMNLDGTKIPQNSLVGIEITTDSEISFEMKNLKRKPYVSSYIDTINKLQSPYYDVMKISEARTINISPSKRNKNQNLNVTIKLISYEL